MRTLNDYFLTAEIEDISTASSTFVAVPDGGKIIKIITALQGAISGGNAADSSANIVLYGSSGSPSNVTQFRTGSTERLRIESSGREHI